MTTDASIESTQQIGRLCVCGDWACAHGDFAGLRHVARQLQDFVADPMHDELGELASACVSDPARAGALWTHIKDVLHHRDSH